MSKRDISEYYDELHRWTTKDASFQTFSGLENATIHRFLIDEETGAFSPETIYKIFARDLPMNGIKTALDAGCGYGGTCLYGAEHWGGHWTGITISPEQVTHAEGIARARHRSDRISYELRSYDHPLDGRYDLIVAIESLIHSQDPSHTLANLRRAMSPSGRLFIADDMPVDGLDTESAFYLEAFKRAWRCPVAPTASSWKSLAARHGLTLVAQHDLSTLQKPRGEADLDAAVADLTRQRAEKVSQGFARLSDAEIGGLHLERLHVRGAMRYVLLVFEAGA